MTQLRTAWRRAVETETADAESPGPDLAELLAFLGPAAEDSLWECDGVEARGPLAGELRQEAAVGPVTGSRLAELAAGITHVSDGAFEATRPRADDPWLAVRVVGDNRFAVATRSRQLLHDLRRRFGG